MPNGNYGDGNIPGRDESPWLPQFLRFCYGWPESSVYYLHGPVPSSVLYTYCAVCMCLSIRVVSLCNLCSGQIITGRETDC